MLTNFFFSQSLLTAAAMLVALMGLLTALVNTHMPVGKPPLREAAGIALTMAALGAPIMLVLFMLFPRLAPLWGVPSDAMAGRSGLSATMEVGSIAELALDDSIAMRIRFEDPPPRQSDLYFRGPVLSTLQGRQWQPLRSGFPARMQDAANLQVSGAADPLPGHARAEQPPLDLRARRSCGQTRCPRHAHAHVAAAAMDGRPAGGRPAALHRAKPYRVPAMARCAAPPPCRTTWTCRRASTRAPWHWASELRRDRGAGRRSAARWSTPYCSGCAPAAIATRWSPASTGRTPPTNSGSTGAPDFANTSHRHS